MLASSKLGADFSRGVRTQQRDRPFPRPTPTPQFTNCSVSAVRQVEHGRLYPSDLLLSVSPTKSLERLAKELNLFEVSGQPSAFSILLWLMADR
jgi:hypothetical protein